MTNVLSHDCRQELHNVSLRATPARLEILDILERADSPLDVSTITSYLSKHRIDVDNATVFRILKTFVQKGIVKPIQFNEGKQRFEYSTNHTHHHFVCEKCGAVHDVDGCTAGELERQIEKMTGGKVKRHSLEFFGFCRKCSV